MYRWRAVFQHMQHTIFNSEIFRVSITFI